MISLRVFFLTLIMLSPTVVDAATVNIVPTGSSNFFPGEIVTFEIVIDFSAEGGTLGGGFDLMFDESILNLVSFTDTVILGDPAFGRPPDYEPGSGLLNSWGVGDFNGINLGVVGEVQFEFLGFSGYDDVLLISLGPTDGIAGPWISAVDFTTIIEPDYGEIRIARIPLPGAIWLLLSALGTLGWSRASRS